MSHDVTQKNPQEAKKNDTREDQKPKPADASQTNPHASAKEVLDSKPEGKHFNEGVTPRSPQKGNHLGATEDDVVPITAPQIVDEEEKSEVEEETQETIEDDMTGG